ncbi:MAG: DUF4010 domain-containing protein [Sphingomonas sp.]|uniref:MgtC/SapB family protein n=1 Tax=Sphingomonas sp. TaxID=28214 RepID=UPI0022763422|nr:DUF4010 domain-containing protein [Sphingomonas sp.]MCX8476988.1 DUF4010 domain-containing protein [Sphingomonas sp.]
MPDFVPGLALALAIGLLIGFERGWQFRDEPDGQRVAGVRTFAILGLLGGLAGLTASGALLALGLVLVVAAAAMLLIGHALAMRQDGNVSATAAVAAFATMLLGALASTGQHALAAIAAAAIVTLLSARGPLHRLVEQSSEQDVRALVRLALVAFLVLPLLPDTGIGPHGSLNPRRIWVVVVVIGTISFAGYILTRWQGPRHGSLVAAALGALVSSTAVTLACAHAIRRGEGAANQAGVALASAIMLARTLLLVAALAPLALSDVAMLVGPALAVAIVAAALLLWATAAHGGSSAEVPAKPPGLATAFLFAALVAVITVAAAWLEHRIGEGGGAAVIAIGGMVDVDSAIAAIGALPASALSARLAALAIAAPVAFNTLLKLGLLLSIAGWRRAQWAALALLLPVVAVGASTALLLA